MYDFPEHSNEIITPIIITICYNEWIVEWLKTQVSGVKQLVSEPYFQHLLVV